MRLLVVTQYFWPESFIINDFVKTLADQGHTIVVATGKPNYPGGEIFEGYSADGPQWQRYDERIEVVRAPLRPRGSGSGWHLLLNYISFAWSGISWFPSLLAGREFDAILAFVPSPIVSAIPAIIMKWKTKAPLAIWIQDLWPESLEATGHVRSKLLLKVAGVVVRGIYAAADTLLVQSLAFVLPVKRYAAATHIAYLPNSVRETTPSGAKGVSIPVDLTRLLEDHFCFVFAGNIGSAQSMETIVDAASRILDLTDVRVVIFGSGSMSEWVIQAAQTRGVTNLTMAGRFPSALMPDIYLRASCLLVTLRDHEILSYTVPSKLQGYLAAGRPIIAALNGEGARIVEEAGAGLTCGAADAGALALCMRKLHAVGAFEREQMGAAGRRYFLENFTMEAQAHRLIGILEDDIQRRRKAVPT